MARWSLLHPPPDATVAPARWSDLSVEVRHTEVLRRGRPGILDVLATVGERTAHVALGLRRPGDQPHFLRAGDDAVLGLLEDDVGLGVVVDALGDAELAVALLEVVTGGSGAPEGATVVAEDPGVTVLAMAGRTMTVFGWPADGPHPGIELLVALDDAGFNHVRAPLALWRREGRDLGVVQEQLPGTASGWALAVTSLRDLFSSGGRPEEAGGDFGPEAHAIGIMTARMHLACDRAFGRGTGPVSAWLDGVEEAARATAPDLLEDTPVARALSELRAADLRGTVLRTHGDYHLACTARTDAGWVVSDVLAGGCPPGCTTPVRRSPLADVADMLWSLRHVAGAAASERDPTGRSGLEPAARAWESRNRRAFLNGYLSTPGIGGLVPPDGDVARALAAVLEVASATSRRPPPGPMAS